MSKLATIAEVESHLSDYLAQVEQGEEVIICDRDKPVAKITSVRALANRSRPGWGKGTINILGPVTGPVMEDDWSMLH
ncbi:MAG: type II toxin-antitoxin system Phd/YefM family antitoxin [Tepidisphaerales bacterium]